MYTKKILKLITHLSNSKSTKKFNQGSINLLDIQRSGKKINELI